LGALTSRTPATLFIESAASTVPGEYPQPSPLNAATAHLFEHRVMCELGDSGTPKFHGGSEVQELVASYRSEADHCAVDQDHVAVDARRRYLVQPTLRYVIAGKRVGILWEHVGETENRPWFLDGEHVRDIPCGHGS
jgi:hypothetical protein